MSVEDKAALLKALNQLNITTLSGFLDLVVTLEQVLLTMEYVKGRADLDQQQKAPIMSPLGRNNQKSINDSLSTRNTPKMNINSPFQDRTNAMKYYQNGLTDVKYYNMCCTKAMKLVLDYFKQPQILQELSLVESILKEVDQELIRKEFKDVSIDLILKRIYQEYRNRSTSMNFGGFGGSESGPKTAKEQAESLERIGHRLSFLFQAKDIFASVVKQVPEIKLEPKMQNNVLTKRGRIMIQRGLCKSNQDNVIPLTSGSFLEEWWGWEYLSNHYGFILVLGLLTIMVLLN